MFDADGSRILDMFPGWAVSGIGHCHPKVVEAVRRQAGELLTLIIPCTPSPRANWLSS